MLRSPIKKLVAAILAAALLLTMAMPSAALAAPSPTEAGQAKSYEGNATVRSGESDDWTFVPKLSLIHICLFLLVVTNPLCWALPLGERRK